MNTCLFLSTVLAPLISLMGSIAFKIEGVIEGTLTINSPLILRVCVISNAVSIWITQRSDVFQGYVTSHRRRTHRSSPLRAAPPTNPSFVVFPHRIAVSQDLSFLQCTAQLTNLTCFASLQRRAQWPTAFYLKKPVDLQYTTCLIRRRKEFT